MATKTPLFMRKQTGGVFTLVDESRTTGDYVFVHAGTGADAAGYGGNPDKPVATIDYAIGLCTAAKNDVVVCMPGHAETVTGATGCVLDVQGVSVIGIGEGALRPLITLSTAAGATISVTATCCTLKNLRLHSSFTNGVTAGITLGAAADYCVIDGVTFTEAANTKEFLIGVKVTADCDDVTIQNCRYYGIAGGTTSSIISLLGGADRSVIRNNFLSGDCSAALLKADAAASSDLLIEGNKIINVDTGAGLGVANHNSSTGFVVGNVAYNAKDTVVAFTGTGMAYCENYGTNAANASGIILPAVDS